MLWKKPWEPEAVLLFVAGVVAVFVLVNLAGGLMRHAGVAGFQSDLGAGMILSATLGLDGAVLLLAPLFLRSQNTCCREVLGATGWKRCLGLAVLVLAVAAPVLLGLKHLVDLLLIKIGMADDQQEAVEMIMGARLWIRIYLVIFAMFLAPVAEEFLFRGVLFSTAKRHGWRKAGYIGGSLLFALIHANLPSFVPLFFLALALTWLYEKTEGLLAPMMAHCLFNTANLVLLWRQLS